MSLGLVVGLNSPHAKLDVHGLLQKFKTHRFVRSILEGGRLVEWGAKTIPEGGYHSIPERRHGDGICVVGDAAGYVDVPSLKGIHYAIHSGILAARTIFRALKVGDTSRAGLRAYTEAVDESFIMDDLRRTRNMRLSFRSGLFTGASRACLMMLTGGRFPGRTLRTEDDAEIPRRLHDFPSPVDVDGKLTFRRRMPCSDRGTVPGTTFPLISSLRETCRPMSRSYTPICARRESTRARGVAWWSTLPTASTVRLRMCWARDGPRGRAAANLRTGACRGPVGRQVGAGSASGKGAPGYECRVRQAQTGLEIAAPI